MKNRFRHFAENIRLSSVVLILLGFLLMLCPDFGSKAVALALGWGLTVLGILAVAATLISHRAFGYGVMGGGLVLLILGVTVLSKPMLLASMVGILLGGYLAFTGFGVLSDAFRLRRNGFGGTMGMVWAALLLVLGMILILSPMTTSRVVMRLVGGVMIICGVGGTVNRYRLRHFLEQQSRRFEAPEEDDIIDV